MASTASIDPFTTSVPPVPRQTPASLAPEPIATPTHGSGGSFTVHSSTHIDAPPDIAFNTLLQHSQWPEWNRFVRKVSINSAPPPSDPGSNTPALLKQVCSDDGSKYLKKGTKMTFNVHMNPDNATYYIWFGMEVTLLEPFDPDGKRKGWRIAWKATTLPSFLQKSERIQELVDDGKGGTEFTCWETMYGPIAGVTKWATGSSLEKGFQCWAEDLKARAEKVAVGQAQG